MGSTDRSFVCQCGAPLSAKRAGTPIRLFAAAAALLLVQTLAGATCFSYNTAVTISGAIKAHTFPGPPNYENIEAGDRPETSWILKPDQPICVEANPDIEWENYEVDVSAIQLVFRAASPELKSSHVQVQGTLFHAHTGHHHTNVLMDVQEYNVIKMSVE